ncbi:MAG TPA: metallopeptidase family protein [Acidobacteriota bacterium]|nr:metallopeptidase family protein [Acidobacteriota bacterium]
MEKQKFEKLVEEALSEIHEEFQKYLKNITVIVEDHPPPEVLNRMGISRRGLLLGLYHGVPLKHRGPYYGNIPPDVISIYQKPIERICSSEEEIKKKVREVVRHEIGHYFGKSDKELKEIENDIE